MSLLARIFWCLLAILVITAVAVFLQNEDVETDLADRSSVAIPSQLQELVSLQLNGRDATLSGLVYSKAQGEKISDQIQNTHGVRVIDESLEIIPTRSPYTLTARQLSGQLVLEGSYPTPELGRSLVGAAKSAFPNATSITNNMTLAQGAPGDDLAAWQAQITSALPAISDLKMGAVEFSDFDVRIVGEAKTSEQYEAYLASPPISFEPPFKLVSVDIEAPLVSPFSVVAEKAQDEITVSGHSTSQQMRERLETTIGQPGNIVRSTLPIARGLTDEKFSKYTDVTSKAFALMSDGVASLEDDTILISGTAKDVQSYNALKDLGNEDLAKGMSIEWGDIIPPTISPYEIGFTKSAQGISVVGFTPDEALRDAFISQLTARYPDQAIDAKLDIARGVTAVDWGMRTVAALDTLDQLSQGRVELSDLDVSIIGDAKDHTAYDNLNGASAGFVDGFNFNIAKRDIEYPIVTPFKTQLKRDIDGSFVLSGFVPDEKARAEIKSKIVAVFGAVEFTDKSRIARGAPEGISGAMANILGQSSRLASGEISLNGTKIALSAKAYTTSGLQALQSDLASVVSAGFTVDPIVDLASQGEPLELEACQARLKYWTKVNKIRFESGSATIDRVSLGVLDALSYAISRCAEAVVQVQGHTDSAGDDGANQRLSEARANSVVAVLVANGVAQERINAVGFGETQPIADNETEDGRAVNRRIEFVVTAQQDAVAN